MNEQKLKIIKELMDELVDSMEYSKDDFDERLGRKKPDVEVLKVEGEIPMEEMSPEEHQEMMGMEDENEPMEDEEECSPDEKLVKRMMKLRE